MLHILISYWLMHHRMFIVLLTEVFQDLFMHFENGMMLNSCCLCAFDGFLWVMIVGV